MKRVIVSVAVGKVYERCLPRLERTLKEHGYRGDFISFKGVYPPDSPTHQEMNYAFKVYAVRHCIKAGYETILWMDSAMYATKPVEPIFELTEMIGYYLFHGIDILGKWTADKALEEYGYTRDQMMYEYLLGGCLYGICTHSETAMKFLDRWDELARGGWFMGTHYNVQPTVMRSIEARPMTEREMVSTDPRCEGHRSDEAMLGLESVRRAMRVYPLGHFVNGGDSIMRTGGPDD
jgi:hypothetical protein